MSFLWVDAGQGLRFIVVIDGTPLGNWQKCEGLTITYKTESYEEGCGDEKASEESSEHSGNHRRSHRTVDHLTGAIFG